MILQALWITIVGMGGVFGFLLFLIAGIALLKQAIKYTDKSDADKIAAAIAVATSQN